MMIKHHDLLVAPELSDFIERRVLAGLGFDAHAFWAGASNIFASHVTENRALLRKRDALQTSLDRWHGPRRNRPGDPQKYRAFLRAIEYLVDEPAPFQISTANVDAELAHLAGPQLVVPVLNERFLLNAANARWGSLYDALYGTDAIPFPPSSKAPYDSKRGALVIARAKAFLDEAVPLGEGSHAVCSGYRVENGRLLPALADASAFVGWRGDANTPASILLQHHGLHIEIQLDRSHPVGRHDCAGIADIVIESALTTIVDFEDSVAAVDAEDKVRAYANWLGVMRGDLTATFDKCGRTITRGLNPDRTFRTPAGNSVSLPGRALLLVRNVGHHMTTPAVLLQGGVEAPEGILDAIVTTLIATYDLHGLGRWPNSSTKSIYIVKPKMHGPEEAGFTGRLFDAVEDMLGLPRSTVKIGLMDEERRTSANLAACVYALRDRLAFINTGFLDRTGDEIHSTMMGGAVTPKAAMRASTWLQAYEDRNVRIGLACGLSGKAQIGKGMWAAPDRMADMLEQKIAHPRAGATTAWVPNPTAATLHALHYHAVDVFARHEEIPALPGNTLEDLLTPPFALDRKVSSEEVREELRSNAQSILGYVVRWIDQGVGCSKVPDINDIGLMEDRATLRISSQLIANWLVHRICTLEQVIEAFELMAAKVDAQNFGDPFYQPMHGRESSSLAFQAACALALEGAKQANGYTERLLHLYRLEAKRRRSEASTSANSGS